MLLQVIIALLLLLAWVNTAYKLRNKKINLGEFIFWSALWLGLLIFGLFPQIPGFLSNFLGIGRAVDMIIYASVFILFFLMFKLYVKLEEQKRELTSLVRELAIKRARKK